MKIQKRQEIEFFGTKTGNANSIALGYATETKNFGEVAVGVMNKSTAAKDPNSPKGVCVDSDATLFSVGCGGSGERKNALEVKGDGSVLISGENGDINVADKIKQALDTDASIELVKSAESDLQYTLMVNNESRGSINIPKDQFLKNVTYDTEAKQLVFTFVTLDEEEHVERISINDLKDVYTAGDGINIDNNVISADFSSVMTAISDEKTQRETTDDKIKAILDIKAELIDVVCKGDNHNINGGFDDDGNKHSDGNYGCINIGFNNSAGLGENSISIGNDNSISDGDNDICIGIDNSIDGDLICIGKKIKTGSLTNSVCIGEDINMNTDAGGINNIIIGSYDNDAVAKTPVRFISIGYNPYIDNKGDIIYQIGGYKTASQEAYNLETTLTYENEHKKYIYGIGGYDGTDPITTKAKSLQEVLDEKADTSAMPTKLSDLENDKVNITTSKDETSYSFKIDYKDDDVLRSTLGYKPENNNTNIAEFNLCSYDTSGNRFSQIRMRPENNKDDGQYLIQVQDVKGDKVNKVSSIATTGFDNQNYENGTAVLLESDHLEFHVISNGFQKQLTVNKDGITKKDGKATEVFAANGTLFDLTTKADASAYYTKTEIDGKGYLTAHQSLDDYAKQTDIDALKAAMTDYFDDTLKGYATVVDMYANVSTKADLVDGKLKAEQLPKLDNIAAAATTEDMITKFNALLTDLKAKGYMTADITA